MQYFAGACCTMSAISATILPKKYLPDFELTLHPRAHGSMDGYYL